VGVRKMDKNYRDEQLIIEMNKKNEKKVKQKDCYSQYQDYMKKEAKK
jgi:hypothetical protein